MNPGRGTGSSFYRLVLISLAFWVWIGGIEHFRPVGITQGFTRLASSNGRVGLSNLAFRFPVIVCW